MDEFDASGPNSDLLRTFHAVAEAGNVTQAAALLGRTQSAISVQIRKLEETLSVRLFERRARGVTLTDEGKRLLPVARKALQEIDRVAALFADPLAGKVRVGLPDDYSETVLAPALARFASRHAQVEIFARSGCTAGFPDAIARQELDLALYSAGRVASAEILFSEPTVWAAKSDLVLAVEAPIPLVLFDRDCWWRNVATDALDKAGLSWRVAYLSENFLSVRAAIAAGLGVGILAESSLGPGLCGLGADEGFPALPPSALTLLKSSRAQTPAVKAMEEALRTAMPA
ncbi:MAG: LysR family transcriptional regulator [Rhodospirillales bacterium]